MAHIIDTHSYEIVANILVDPRPRHAEFTPDGKKLWITSEIGGTVSIIDMATYQIEKKITFEIPGVMRDNIQPVGVKMTMDGKTAFVALGPAARVAVVDVAKGEVVKYLLVGQRVWHLALTPEEDLLFTTNGVSNDVTVVEVASLKPVKSIKVGRYPWGAAVKTLQVQ
jgi:PQQ-dependent catabolism-associated beta-propeller protein